ncbi:MAG: hypothetical protein WBC73_17605 [Phormidesmis sp.]
MTPTRSTYSLIKPLLAGGLMFSLIGLLLEVNGLKTVLSDPVAFASIPTARGSAKSKAIATLEKSCESDITETSKLSREQLLKLLAVPERESKARIRQIIPEPYCQLSTLDIRAGVGAQREAYPLEFDPDTTLVLLYENDEYAGYRFKH